MREQLARKYDLQEARAARRPNSSTSCAAVPGLAPTDLFRLAPVSLWVENWRVVKLLLDRLRVNGVTDFRTFADVHPEFVEQCMREVHLVDVNVQALTLLHGRDRDDLVCNFSGVFREEARQAFAEQLAELWSGVLVQQRETAFYTLNSDRVDVQMQFSIMPGHESDWTVAMVSLTDISARKRAEEYLEYLGKHDTLTSLRNRSYFDDEIARLNRRGPWPVAVLALDLNGLKAVNDTYGHAAGDALLRRAGEVLTKAADPVSCVARIGGDEFCVLMPRTGLDGAGQMMDRLRELTERANAYDDGPELSFAMGLRSASTVRASKPRSTTPTSRCTCTSGRLSGNPEDQPSRLSG